MAQAQVVISAVDKTQAAINSALRGMKNLERSARVTSRAINAAFGFFTGGILVNAFRSILDAANKTKEGAASVKQLKETLADPGLIAAANSISKALVDGFIVAAGGVKAFTKLVRQELIAIGAATPVTSEEAIISLERKINDIRKKYSTDIKGSRMALGQVSPEDQAIIAGLERQIAALKVYKPSETSARGRTKVSEINAMINASKASIKMDELLAKQREDAKRKSDAAAMSMAEKQAQENQRYQELRNQALEINDLFKVEFDDSLTNMSSSISEMLDEFAAQQEMFKMFAENAAKNIQSAFADFLFDPFQNGIRGMLASFIDVIRRMVAEVAASFILQAIFGGFTKDAGFMGDFARAITGRASGGSVSANTPYIVGERGPELFVPNSSGSIVPNGRMGGVTVAPVYNIDARGATADLQKALPSILSENNRRIFDELDRRYGIGR
jgi:hypothetical protein